VKINDDWKTRGVILFLLVGLALTILGFVPSSPFSILAQRPDPPTPDLSLSPTPPAWCLLNYGPIEWQCTPTPIPTSNGSPISPIAGLSVPMKCYPADYLVKYPNGVCFEITFLYLPIMVKN